MPIVSEAQARAALEKVLPAPIYLLVGDDEPGKDSFLHELNALVEPDLQPFNLQRYHANEHPPDEIVAAARTLPWSPPGG